MKVKRNMRAHSHIDAPRQPTRRRGELRVAALLEAAAATFAQQGYEAATMSAIALRAGASIGSLYQFFPSKEALAGELVTRYGQRLESSLAEVAGRAKGLTPQGFADALVDLRLQLRRERAAMLALIEARHSIGDRARLREAMRAHMSNVLRALNPAIPSAKARAMAIVVLAVLKLVPALVEEDPRETVGLIRELRGLLSRYVAGARAPRSRREP
jgi:AcrR family transcriptional regulator